MGCISKEPLLMSLTKEQLLMGLTTELDTRQS